MALRKNFPESHMRSPSIKKQRKRQQKNRAIREIRAKKIEYIIKICPACPASPVASENGTGLAPGDGTGMKRALHLFNWDVALRFLETDSDVQCRIVVLVVEKFKRKRFKWQRMRL